MIRARVWTAFLICVVVWLAWNGLRTSDEIDDGASDVPQPTTPSTEVTLAAAPDVVERVPTAPANRALDTAQPLEQVEPRSIVARGEIVGVARVAETLQPIVGAAIELFDVSLFPVRKAATTTDSGGHFQFDGIEPGRPLAVDVRLPGAISFRSIVDWPRREQADLGELQTVTMEILVPAGAACRVRVEDARSRSPIAGARLLLGDLELGVTDAIGEFTIRGLTTTKLYVDVLADRYCITRFRVDRDALESRLVIPLLRGVTLRGRVADLAGRPLSGVVVYGGQSLESSHAIRELVEGLAAKGISIRPVEADCESDREGNYQLVGIYPSNKPFALCARRDRSATDSGRLIEELLLDAPEVEIVRDIVFGPATCGLIDGSVSLDRKVVAARVRLIGNGVDRSTTAGANGIFRFAEVPIGAYVVRAEFSGTSEERELTVLPDGLHFCVLRMRSRDPVVTRGRVVSETSEGFQNARIEVRVGEERSSVFVKPNGEFEHTWYGAPGAVATLEYQDAFQQVRCTPVTLGQQNIELRVRAAHRVRAKLLVRSGVLPEWVQVSWRDVGTTEFVLNRMTSSHVRSDSEVEFLVPVGDLDIRLSEVAEPRRFGELLNVRVAADTPILEVSLREP